MSVTFKKTVQYFSNHTARLFLLDGVGAAFTSLTLCFIAAYVPGSFGFPTFVLHLLSGIGFSYCLYSLSCHIMLKKNWTPFLRVISAGNLLYCCLTVFLLFYYATQLSWLAAAYFLPELFIIGLLAIVELRVSNDLSAEL